MESRNFYDGNWNTFVDLCVSYLEFARDVDPNNIDTYYIKLIQFFTALSPAFSNFRGSVLQGVVKSSAKLVVNISQTLDKRDNHTKRTNYASTLLLKMFNSIRAEKLDPNNPNALSKKKIILRTGNLLCRAYYTMKSHASCANVFSNIDSSNINLNTYTKSELVEYRYFIGRFYLDRAQQIKSYTHLSWAFQNSLPNSPNRRRILEVLIAVSLVLGKLPKLQLLQQFNLADIYWPLVTAVKTGNYRAFMDHLHGPFQTWFYANRLLIFLSTRSQILLFRNIFRQVWLALGQKDILKFPLLQKALVYSIQGGSSISPTVQSSPSDMLLIEIFRNDTDYINTENVAISLISQGFLKGNIFTRSEVVKIKPTGAFVPVSEVHGLNKITFI